MAFCTGCGDTFRQTHLLRAHRNTFRCGGEWLPGGYKYDLTKPPLEDVTAGDRINGTQSNNYWKQYDDKRGRKMPRHKARIPGTIRVSRLTGGSGFRNNWEDKFPAYTEVMYG